MKKTVAILFAILLAAGLRAQDAAGVAMPFSVVPRNVRTLSMGGVTAGDDASFRLLGEDKLDVSASWYLWAPGGASSNDINADAFFRIGQRLALTAQFGYDAGAKYDIYDAQGQKGGYFSPSDLLLKIGAAYRITPILSAGLSARLLGSTLAANTSYSAFSADATVAASFSGARVIAGVTNLGWPVHSSDDTAFPLPAAAMVAGSYGLSFAGAHSIDVRAQVDYFFKGGIRAGAGLEYGFKDLAFLRLGYSYGGKSPFPTYFSAGLGVKFSGFSVNATYLLGSEAVGGTLGVGLGYAF